MSERFLKHGFNHVQTEPVVHVQIDSARVDLGKVENVVDHDEQRFRRNSLDGIQVLSCCSSVRLRIHAQIRHA